jgi:CAP12/Pycsar effector protein, TIR domain
MSKKKAAGETRREQRARSDFPKHTLADAVRVPQAVEGANAGQPLPPVDTAMAMDISPGSSTLRTLLSAAINYGLTEGSYQADKVSLTPLGRSIVEPTSEEDKQSALVRAALTPTTFRKIYEYLKGKKLPETVFFENAVVREFGVPREHAKLCVSIFAKNMEFINALRLTRAGSWLGSDVVPSESPDTAIRSPDKSDASGAVPDESKLYSQSNPPGLEHPEPSVKNAIFVGHGRNKKPLEQLKQILDQYQIPHRVAVDEANQGRPISTKVADLMHQCGAGILIFTADEEFKDEQGNSKWKPSDNVVYELGAASVLYGGRIIVFKEDAVDFATNFRDIGYISFERDALSNKTNELFKELIAFGLIKVSVGT